VAQKLLYPLRDFSLGINDKDDPALIADNALVDAQNAIVGRGYVSKRYGYTKYNATALAAAVHLLYTFYKNSGNELLAVSGTKVYKDAAGTFSQIPFNVITALASNDVQMVTYKDRSQNDVVLIADQGKLKVYNGTNVGEVTPHTPTPSPGEADTVGANDLGTNFAAFRAIAIKQDRIFALANGNVKNRLCFCHRDPDLGYAVYDYWPAKYFYDMVSDQNDESITLRTFRNAVIVFNRRSMWSLTGDGTTVKDYNLWRINVPSGLIAKDSIAFVGNFIFYLSDDHVYRLFSTDQDYISAEIVSYNVENTLKGISAADKAQAKAIYFDNKYWLSFPSGLTLVYDVLLNAWTKFTNIAANGFIERDEELYFSHSSGYVYKFDPAVFSDDGVAISGKVKLKRQDYGFPVQDKKFRRAWFVAKQFDAESSTFSAKAIVDTVEILLEDKEGSTILSSDESLVWDEGDWDEASWDFKEMVQIETRLREKGKTIQYEITFDGLNQPFTLYQVVTEYKLKKP
jgi:hypothetical protein